MTVDPVDDCTFWYTNEYYQPRPAAFNWRTRIGNFKFAECGGDHADTDTHRYRAHRDPHARGDADRLQHQRAAGDRRTSKGG